MARDLQFMQIEYARHAPFDPLVAPVTAQIHAVTGICRHAGQILNTAYWGERINNPMPARSRFLLFQTLAHTRHHPLAQPSQIHHRERPFKVIFLSVGVRKAWPSQAGFH
jgi:hypothetical protein